MKRSVALLAALAFAGISAAAQTNEPPSEAAAPEIAAAQTNEPPSEAAAPETAAAPRPTPADMAEAALRDGIPSLAFDAATNALALAETDAARERAFEIAAAARERTASPADMLAWLDEAAGALEGIPPAADYFRARALAALGRHAEAIRLLRPLAGGALGESPLTASVRRDLAYSLGVSGRVAEALELFGRPEPGNAPAALDLARLLLSAGEPERGWGWLIDRFDIIQTDWCGMMKHFMEHREGSQRK